MTLDDLHLFCWIKAASDLHFMFVRIRGQYELKIMGTGLPIIDMRDPDKGNLLARASAVFQATFPGEFPGNEVLVFKGKVYKRDTSSFWQVELPFLDLLAQTENRSEVLEVLELALLREKPGFKFRVRWLNESLGQVAFEVLGLPENCLALASFISKRTLRL